jgi:hypothetical protein
MRGQSSPLPEQDHIAGLVDGSFALQRDADGGLSLQLTFGPTDPEHRRNSPLLEIGLSDESARDLLQFLLSEDEPTLRLDCHVGVRARDI